MSSIAFENLKWEVERQRKRNEYWLMLKRAKEDYNEILRTNFVQPPHHEKYGGDVNGFYYYMQRTYGVKVNLVDGKIDTSYQIVDEKKHMIFLMKYSS